MQTALNQTAPFLEISTPEFDLFHCTAIKPGGEFNVNHLNRNPY